MDKTSATLNTVIEAIKNRLKLCFFNLINDATLDTEGERAWSRKDLKALKKEAFDIFGSLPSLLNSEDSDRNSAINSLSVLRDKILETGLGYYSCMDSLCEAQNIVMREIIERENGKVFSEEEELASPEEILHFLREFYESAVGEKRKDGYFRQMLSLLPCKMSKGMFAEYAERSLAKDTASIRGNYFYRTNMYPFTISEGRSIFPEKYEYIDKVLNSKLNQISDEELSDINGVLNNETTEIFDYADCISMLYSDANYMIALLLYAIDTDFVTDEDLVAKDLFYSAAELCKKDSLDEIDIDLKRQTNEKSEGFIENIDDDISKAKTAINKYIDSLEAASNEDPAVRTAGVLRNVDLFYLAEAYEEVCRFGQRKCYGEDEKSASENAAEIFIAEFEEAQTDFSPAVKKALRKEFFSLLPCPYSYSEFESYLRSVLEQYYRTPKYKTVLGSVSMVLNAFGEEFEKNHHHHHHDHDHDCGCGHDHHHDHDHSCDCGCDHDHDHNHNHFHHHL